MFICESISNYELTQGKQTNKQTNQSTNILMIVKVISIIESKRNLLVTLHTNLLRKYESTTMVLVVICLV